MSVHIPDSLRQVVIQRAQEQCEYCHTALFNPRTQQWAEHFRFGNGQIVPLTPYGRVTVFLLRLNDKTRVEERIALNISMESYEEQ